MRCPCRKKSETRAYADCCGPYHAGTRPAPSAETLMRSRYSAFARRDSAYLLATWHPSTRPAGIAFEPGQEWLLLRILAARTDGERATVEFVARSRISGKPRELHEISRFVRENDRWLYIDGEIR
jgi:SEC-C motif-containing protein